MYYHIFHIRKTNTTKHLKIKYKVNILYYLSNEGYNYNHSISKKVSQQLNDIQIDKTNVFQNNVCLLLLGFYFYIA